MWHCQPKLRKIWFAFILAFLTVSIAFGQLLWTLKSQAAATKETSAAQLKPARKAAAGDTAQDDLVAQGRKRFEAYRCYDCHGDNGEGTADAPDLTHSKLTAEEVSKFLVKPSADAQTKGMPDVPLDSPDHKPLVAYVMSLRAK